MRPRDANRTGRRVRIRPPRPARAAAGMLAILVGALLVVAAVASTGTTDRAEAGSVGQVDLASQSAEPASSTADPEDPVVTAAGDLCGTPIDCAPTAALVTAIDPTRALTLGDNEQTDGTLAQFQAHYAPSWGGLLARTRPAPGNHEYRTPGAAGYFDFFGARAPQAYYSFEVGSWHLVSLESEIDVDGGSAQETWFREDLASHPTACTLVYWHKPRWSSGHFGPSDKMDQLWRDAYAAGVDVILSGHDHIYERFAPQSGAGELDPERGIRQFVVGTGGWAHGDISAVQPNSRVRDGDSWGVLRLRLHPESYRWTFVPVAGTTFTDSGLTSCH